MLGGWISYWMIPLFSATIWLAMILTMLIYWLTTGQVIYSSMQPGQTIVYISDVGADYLKPLFIAMGATSVVSFSFVFIAEQYLRTTGRMTKNTRGQKILAWLSILFAILGAAGLILLAVFDTKRYPTLHNLFLAFFIGGYVFSAVFTCWEYQRLGARHRSREDRVLRVSFWIKLAFILIEVGLAVAFGSLNRVKNWNGAAVVEWVIAFVYTFYVASFALDFKPALRSGRNDVEKMSLHEEVAQAPIQQAGMAHDEEAPRYYPSGTTAGGLVGGANGMNTQHAFR